MGLQFTIKVITFQYSSIRTSTTAFPLRIKYFGGFSEAYIYDFRSEVSAIEWIFSEVRIVNDKFEYLPNIIQWCF